MRHFLDIKGTPKTVLRSMLDEAKEIKESRRGQRSGAVDEEPFLEDCVIGLIFEKPSTRTRVSFDVGIRQMGGQSIVLSSLDLQLSNGENISDTAKVLSGYLDMLMIRTFDESLMIELALSSTIPIINGLTNCSHPCQVMADILTYEEVRGCIEGKNVVWIGDGNNVCASYIHAAAQFGFHLKVASPEEFRPNSTVVRWANQIGTYVEVVSDPSEAIKNADLVVTDTFTSMHDEKLDAKNRIEIFKSYQVTSELMSIAKSDAIFLHCLPAHRNLEVTSEVIDGPQSAVFRAAENRLHVQKAIMKWCIEGVK